MSKPVLIIDPALGIDSQELEKAWKEDPACRALGRIEPAPQPPGHFDPTRGTVALTFAISVVTGLTTNLLTEAFLYFSRHVRLDHDRRSRPPLTLSVSTCLKGSG